MITGAGRGDPMTALRSEVEEAVQEFNWSVARRAAAAYATHIRDAAQTDQGCARVLKLLLNNRQYDAVMDVAEAALAVAPGDRAVWRVYAQALVDQGRIAPALRIYTSIAGDPAAPADDHAEAHGGIGRCYKQLCLAAADSPRRVEYLQRALEAYSGLYFANPGFYWHGINAVALLAYAQRRSITVAGIADPGRTARDLASAVLATVADSPEPWEIVTACEAFVARNEVQLALEHAREFVEHPATNAFMIGSFLRQLLEVWEIKPDSELGATLLPLLRSAKVLAAGGSVTLQADDVAATRIERLERLERGGSETGLQLEKVFGADRFQTIQWWRSGLMRCRAVVRIDDLNGVGRGTGFLIKGTDLHPNLPPLVVITNCHVVPDAVQQCDAKVAFRGLDDDDVQRKAFDVKQIWWSSSPSPPGVDATLLELCGTPDNVEPMPLVNRFPKLNDTSRAYIIGHPRGYEKPQFSIQDNLVVDYDDTRLHYRSPTEGGSSGSPVFESQWKVIGLHHAGSETMSYLKGKRGTYAANEALRIDAIRSAISSTGI